MNLGSFMCMSLFLVVVGTEAAILATRVRRRLLGDPRRAEDLTESLGRMLGLGFHGVELDGPLGGAHVQLRISAYGEGKISWVGTVRGGPAHTSFGAGRGDVTGDPRFDGAVTLSTLLPALSAHSRRAVVHAVQAGAEMRHGTAYTTGVANSLDEVSDVIRTVAAAVRSLRSETATLQDLAESDPHPAVRASAIRSVAPTLGRAWLSTRADDPDAGVAVVVAALLSDVPRLMARLSGDAGAAALAALAKHEPGPDPRIDHALACWLPVHPEPTLIALAERVGTVAVVPVLGRIGGRRAEDAVRAIQARTHGERGSLAVAVETGGLSTPGVGATARTSDEH